MVTLNYKRQHQTSSHSMFSVALQNIAWCAGVSLSPHDTWSLYSDCAPSQFSGLLVSFGCDAGSLGHCVFLLLRNGLSVESRRLSPRFPSFFPTHTSYIILTPEKHTASQQPSVIYRHHVWCSFIWFPVLSLQFWCRW